MQTQLGVLVSLFCTGDVGTCRAIHTNPGPGRSLSALFFVLFLLRDHRASAQARYPTDPNRPNRHPTGHGRTNPFAPPPPAVRRGAEPAPFPPDRSTFQFWGQLQPSRRRLQPTAVGYSQPSSVTANRRRWRPTAISCSSSWCAV